MEPVGSLSMQTIVVLFYRPLASLPFSAILDPLEARLTFEYQGLKMNVTSIFKKASKSLMLSLYT